MWTIQSIQDSIGSWEGLEKNGLSQETLDNIAEQIRVARNEIANTMSQLHSIWIQPTNKTWSNLIEYQQAKAAMQDDILDDMKLKFGTLFMGLCQIGNIYNISLDQSYCAFVNARVKGQMDWIEKLIARFWPPLPLISQDWWSNPKEYEMYPHDVGQTRLSKYIDKLCEDIKNDDKITVEYDLPPIIDMMISISQKSGFHMEEATVKTLKTYTQEELLDVVV